MGRTKTKAADAKTEEVLQRERQALALRLAGASLRAIGDKLGVSHEQARRDIEAALDITRQEVGQEADKYRALEVERLDSLLLSLWSRAKGDPEHGKSADLGAVDRILRIMERRAKLLGLDAPTKIAPTTPDGVKEYVGGLSDDERLARLVDLLDTARARRDRSTPDK